MARPPYTQHPRCLQEVWPTVHDSNGSLGRGIFELEVRLQPPVRAFVIRMKHGLRLCVCRNTYRDADFTPTCRFRASVTHHDQCARLETLHYRATFRFG
eukprot:5489472-Prymnesium_polylepis.1